MVCLGKLLPDAQQPAVNTDGTSSSAFVFLVVVGFSGAIGVTDLYHYSAPFRFFPGCIQRFPPRCVILSVVVLSRCEGCGRRRAQILSLDEAADGVGEQVGRGLAVPSDVKKVSATALFSHSRTLGLGERTS